LARTLGWLLLLGGLAIAGADSYRLWDRGVIPTEAQQDLAVVLEERRVASDPIAVAPPATPTATTLVSQPIVVAQPDETGGGDLHVDPLMHGEAVSGVLPAPGFVEESRPEEGTSLGQIAIPSIDVDWIVVEGVRVDDLAVGPGHGPWTAVPGQPGNSVISGHRTTHGAPFNRLDELLPGDRITVATVIGDHHFEVVGTRIVLPNEMWVTEQWNGVWLTLTTCHPEYSSRERLIVFSRLVDGPNLEASEAAFEVDYTLPEPPEG